MNETGGGKVNVTGNVNIGAEKALLSTVLMDSVGVLPRLKDRVRPEDFYQKSHQAIWRAVLDFDEEQKGVTLDLASLSGWLMQNGRDAECGGIPYLAELTRVDAAPLASTVDYYASLVLDASKRRAVQEFGRKAVALMADGSKGTQQSVDDLRAELAAIAERGGAAGTYKDANNIASEVVDAINPDTPKETGIYTGFRGLDQATDGLHPQQLAIVGARPSVGKTAFALSCVLHMLHDGVKVGFFSLEMDHRSIGLRLLSMDTGIPFYNVMRGQLGSRQSFNQATERLMDLSNRGLWVQDAPNMRLDDLRSCALDMRQKHGVQIIFVDYIGLIENDPRNGRVERWEWVGRVSRSLKQLARELDVPVVALSQLGRDAEGQEPKLSNLRDSGSIEQDADIVAFLHRPRLQDPQPAEDTKLILAKNRNGETGAYTISFRRALVRFENKAPGRMYA